MPHRLVERCAALETLKDSIPQVFADALDHTADLDEFTRVRREMEDFLDKYLETTRDLARIWWQPPLVFVALGDPGHGRTVAQCMLAAFRRRQLPVTSPVTTGIVHEAVKGHSLLRDAASREALQAFGTGSVLDSDSCQPLLRWIQGNAWACPHANLYTESTFNLMDRIKDVGGPRMSPQTTETRVLLHRNHVLPQRSHSPSKKTGKAKRWQWSKDHMHDVITKVEQLSRTYPESLETAARKAVENKHKSPDYMGVVDGHAAHSSPERRKQYNATDEARKLKIPRRSEMQDEGRLSSPSQPRR